MVAAAAAEMIRSRHAARNATNAIVWDILRAIARRTPNDVIVVMVRVTSQKTANRVRIHRPVTIATSRDILRGRVRNPATDRTVTNVTNRDICRGIAPRVRKHVTPATDRDTSGATAIWIIKSSKLERRDGEKKTNFFNIKFVVCTSWWWSLEICRNSVLFLWNLSFFFFFLLCAFRGTSNYFVFFFGPSLLKYLLFILYIIKVRKLVVENFFIQHDKGNEKVGLGF